MPRPVLEFAKCRRGRCEGRQSAGSPGSQRPGRQTTRDVMATLVCCSSVKPRFDGDLHGVNENDTGVFVDATPPRTELSSNAACSTAARIVVADIGSPIRSAT